MTPCPIGSAAEVNYTGETVTCAVLDWSVWLGASGWAVDDAVAAVERFRNFCAFVFAIAAALKSHHLL